MKYEGQAIAVRPLEDGFAELVLDLKNDSVNKLSGPVLAELAEAVDALAAAEGLKGVLVTSAKDVFVVGADITEFLGYFDKPEEELVAWTMKVHGTFSKLEDLPCRPVVSFTAEPTPTGGFDVALDEGPEAAKAFAAEREAVLRVSAQ
jgi:3-hydroxyacyl-CoA dehydrogenase/enoyl-CoA hydratase/3-hydroxybutyryl-CoA epimerase/enoyl-CoA isomerase